MNITLYTDTDRDFGSFDLEYGTIRDCAADVGDDAYEALEEAAARLADDMLDDATLTEPHREVVVDGVVYGISLSWTAEEYLRRTCGSLSDRALSAWYTEGFDPEGITTDTDDPDKVASDIQSKVGNLPGLTSEETVTAISMGCKSYIDETDWQEYYDKQWDSYNNQVFRVLDENNENVANAMMRRWRDGWLYNDDVDGYCRLDLHAALNMNLVEDI